MTKVVSCLFFGFLCVFVTGRSLSSAENSSLPVKAVDFSWDDALVLGIVEDGTGILFYNWFKHVGGGTDL